MSSDAKATKTAAPVAAKPKGMNEWTSDDHDVSCLCHPSKPQRNGEGKPLNNKCANVPGMCCPDDLVINASNRPIILGALASVPKDQARIDIGDRRQGEYYLGVISLPVGLGLQRVKLIPQKRLAELEKMRAVRTGDEPADWIKEVWAKKGKPGPSGLTDPGDAASTFAKLAHGIGD